MFCFSKKSDKFLNQNKKVMTERNTYKQVEEFTVKQEHIFTAREETEIIEKREIYESSIRKKVKKEEDDIIKPSHHLAVDNALLPAAPHLNPIPCADEESGKLILIKVKEKGRYTTHQDKTLDRMMNGFALQDLVESYGPVVMRVCHSILSYISLYEKALNLRKITNRALVFPIEYKYISIKLQRLDFAQLSQFVNYIKGYKAFTRPSTKCHRKKLHQKEFLSLTSRNTLAALFLELIIDFLNPENPGLQDYIQAVGLKDYDQRTVYLFRISEYYVYCLRDEFIQMKNTLFPSIQNTF